MEEKIITKKTTDIDIAEEIPVFVCNKSLIAIEVSSAAVSGDITLLYSLSGDDMSSANTSWLTAVDSNGDDIVETLTAGSYVIFNISDITPGMYFALKFASGTGNVTVVIK
jgi:hypothetical protein